MGWLINSLDISICKVGSKLVKDDTNKEHHIWPCGLRISPNADEAIQNFINKEPLTNVDMMKVLLVKAHGRHHIDGHIAETYSMGIDIKELYAECTCMIPKPPDKKFTKLGE
jgi:hypothetical protein